MVYSLRSSVAYLASVWALAVGVRGFSTQFPSAAGSRTLPRATREKFPTTILNGEVYGKGAEIWPECNTDVVRLADSFPGGQIPPLASMILDKTDMDVIHGRARALKEEERETPRLRRFLTKPIRRILRRAAAREELDDASRPSTMDRTPFVVALGLLAKGLLRPLDILVVAALTSYFVILGMAARSPRDSSDVPILPATPPQGHVPTMVSNPMGIRFGYSKTYEIWLRFGVVLGLIGPLLMLGRYVAINNLAAAKACARPIFLLCCQAITEASLRRSLTPLPIRILVPLSYNIVRLSYLWTWANNPCILGYVGRGLAAASIGYWAINLFAFLIPVASLRYMRAHFFCVEAAEVTTRPGMEDSVGILPK